MTNRTATPTQPRKVAPKVWETECTWGCGAVITTPRKPPTKLGWAMLGCDRPACHTSHCASVGTRGVVVGQRITIRNGV